MTGQELEGSVGTPPQLVTQPPLTVSEQVAGHCHFTHLTLPCVSSVDKDRRLLYQSTLPSLL